VSITATVESDGPDRQQNRRDELVAAQGDRAERPDPLVAVDPGRVGAAGSMLETYNGITII
jgi:hypothetical protein